MRNGSSSMGRYVVGGWTASHRLIGLVAVLQSTGIRYPERHSAFGIVECGAFSDQGYINRCPHS